MKKIVATILVIVALFAIGTASALEISEFGERNWYRSMSDVAKRCGSKSISYIVLQDEDVQAIEKDYISVYYGVCCIADSMGYAPRSIHSNNNEPYGWLTSYTFTKGDNLLVFVFKSEE